MGVWNIKVKAYDRISTNLENGSKVFAIVIPLITQSCLKAPAVERSIATYLVLNNVLSV